MLERHSFIWTACSKYSVITNLADLWWCKFVFISYLSVFLYCFRKSPWKVGTQFLSIPSSRIYTLFAGFHPQNLIFPLLLCCILLSVTALNNLKIIQILCWILIMVAAVHFVFVLVYFQNSVKTEIFLPVIDLDFWLKREDRAMKQFRLLWSCLFLLANLYLEVSWKRVHMTKNASRAPHSCWRVPLNSSKSNWIDWATLRVFVGGMFWCKKSVQ